MTMNKSARNLGLTYLGIFVLFFFFTKTPWSNLPSKDAFFCIGSAAFISLLGLFILYMKKKNDPVANTFRLLIMITVQLLSFLSISLALIYTQQSTAIILHLLGIALTIIISQTLFLVRDLKSSDEF
jgi:hypothetical protein